jgi:hypothetical protein
MVKRIQCRFLEESHRWTYCWELFLVACVACVACVTCVITRFVPFAPSMLSTLSTLSTLCCLDRNDCQIRISRCVWPNRFFLSFPNA